MKNLIICILLSCCSLPVYGGKITGKVTSSGGETLPFATIYIEGTSLGTSASAKGGYELSLPAGTYTVVCQFVGYKKSRFSVTVNDAETINHDFILADETLEMKEVMVHGGGEDPAYPIIRKTIARRAFHLKQVESFQTSIYLKGVLRNRLLSEGSIMGHKIDSSDRKDMQKSMGWDSMGKGVLYLLEENADYYSELPKKQKTVIHSVKESGDPNGLGLSELPPVITLYENNVVILNNLNPRGFISPVADGALNYYKYKLLGDFIDGTSHIFKIRVTAKRGYEPTFRGDLYIVDGDYAIEAANLVLTAQNNMSSLDTLRIKQDFIPIAKDTWVIKNQNIYIAIKIFVLDMNGNLVTIYNNEQVNGKIPDSIFNKKVVSIYDKTANKKDSIYWKQTRPIPLEPDEVKDYRFKDSLYNITESPAYQDSMRRKHNKFHIKNIFLNGYSHQYKKGVTFYTGGLLYTFNYNTVEGLNMAPQFHFSDSYKKGRTLNIAAAVRYGFSNTHFNAIASINHTWRDTLWAGRSTTLGLQGGKYVFQYNPANPVIPIYNTYSTLVNGRSYLKIYERQDITGHLRRNFGNGLSGDIKVSRQHRIPLENTTAYSWAKSKEIEFKSNTPSEIAGFLWEEHNAFITTLNISYHPGVKYVEFPDYKMPHYGAAPTFTFNYTKGIPGIAGSKTDYDKWRLGIEGNVRLRLLGHLDYNIATGGFLNSRYVAYPDLMHLYGNQFAIASPYLRSFQLLPYYQFSNTDRLYGEAHIEYNLQGLLTNKIPLLKQAQWYLIIGNNTYYVNTNKYYTEAFFSIDNLGYKLIRFLRVDFVEQWDNFGNRNTGVRVGLKASGFINVSSSALTNSNTEW